VAEQEITQLRARITELEQQLADKSKTDAALRESRELFQAFMGNSPIAAFLKDESGKYIYANRTADLLIGNGFGQWSNKSDDDLWPGETARRLRENDLRALESNTTIKVAETVSRGQNDLHLLAFKFPFTTAAGNRYLAGVWLDITDRVGLEESERAAREQAETALTVLRQTEARLQCLFDSNVIGIIEINSDRILDANDSFLRMVGRDRDSLRNGELSWREMTPPKYHAIDALAMETLCREGCFRPFEKQLVRSDGVLVPVWVGGALLGVHPVTDPHCTCVAFVLDLTERKDLETQFLSGQRLKSLGLLAGGVAHDFNNLLTTIMGNASLALEALTPEHPAYRPLGEVLRASRVASDLTQQLKMYSGKTSGGVKAIQVSDLVREISGLIEVAIPRKIELRLDLEAGLPAILADPSQVQQVVLNLVINAADAIGEKPGIITIATRSRECTSAQLLAMTLGGDLPGGRYVSFEVSDSGCGMTQEVMAHIFDPLFTTKAAGVGLGLAPVQGIVRSHHGALNLESQVGQGTVFTVLFPASTEQVRFPDAPVDRELWGNELVMVVDDEPSIRKMAEATLTRFGYRVVTAGDGREAVEMFSAMADEISLVILDIAMPEMGGEEALEHLLAIRPNARIVFSSGYNEFETRSRVEGYPFIPKPYTSRQLAEQVREVLAR
jgi:two-component system cell cycle sensor histidine kinase/response regulator CckA